MSRISTAVFAALLALPASAFASDFDGTWKSDPGSWKITTPDQFLLMNGRYTCLAGCPVKQTLTANGADNGVKDALYVDTLAVFVVDDHTVRIIGKKHGVPVTESIGKVSPDGKTLAVTYSSSSDTNGGAPMTGSYTETRVSDGPEGAHLISGKWMFNGAAKASDNSLLTTYKLDGDTLTMTQPTGQSYTAKLGGGDAPFLGDPGLNGVSVRRVGPHAIEETDKLNGAVVWVGTSTVSDDGTTMTTVWDDKRIGQGGSGTATKQ